MQQSRLAGLCTKTTWLDKVSLNYIIWFAAFGPVIITMATRGHCQCQHCLSSPLKQSTSVFVFSCEDRLDGLVGCISSQIRTTLKDRKGCLLMTPKMTNMSVPQMTYCMLCRFMTVVFLWGQAEFITPVLRSKLTLGLKPFPDQPRLQCCYAFGFSILHHYSRITPATFSTIRNGPSVIKGRLRTLALLILSGAVVQGLCSIWHTESA